MITLVSLFVMAAIVGVMAVIMQAVAAYASTLTATLGGL